MVVIPCKARGIICKARDITYEMVVIPCEARGITCMARDITCEARDITAPGALPYGPP